MKVKEDPYILAPLFDLLTAEANSSLQMLRELTWISLNLFCCENSTAIILD